MQKRKRASEAKAVLGAIPAAETGPASNGEAVEVDTSKPTALFKPSLKGRDWTVSVAVPGSIIAK